MPRSPAACQALRSCCFVSCMPCRLPVHLLSLAVRCCQVLHSPGYPKTSSARLSAVRAAGMHRARDFTKLRRERFLSLLAAEAAQAVAATAHL